MHPPTPLPAPARLALEKLQRLCPMRLENYLIGSEKINIWTTCDIDLLLNALVAKDDYHPDIMDERMPYWAELWPSSLLMAEIISEKQATLPKGRWLELGCGPGLPGLMAAKFGRPGIFSDYMQEALWLALLNAHQNECAERTEFLELDWRNPPEKLQVQWILAADLVYEQRNFTPLISTFDQLLESDGEIWLGEPGRSVAEPFFREMKDNGWQHRVLSRRKQISIHRFTR